jgi:hypothetical protein
MITPQEINNAVVKELPPFHETYEMGTKRYLKMMLKVLIWVAWFQVWESNKNMDRFLTYLGLERE